VIEAWNQAIPSQHSMKIISIKLFLAAAAVVSVMIALVTDSQKAPPSNAISAEIEKTILAQLNEIQTAAQALDAERVFTFVLDNETGVIAQNGKIFLTRSNALESTRQDFESLRNAGARVEYHFDYQHVTLLSPTIALATGEGTTSITTQDGKNPQLQFAQSVLFVLTNGDWKVFHAHRSFVPPPR